MDPERTDQELAEVRPGHASLLRHDGADFDVLRARGIPHIDLRSGAVWIRATSDGPGLVVSCVATHVHLRDGAAVVEVRPDDVLVVVAAGQVAVTGEWPLPHTVVAGQGVTATPDGTVREPRPVPIAELAANRMVAENLIRDAMASGVVGTVVTAPPAEGRRVDGTPPVVNVTDAALGLDTDGRSRPRRPAPPLVTGPEARPQLVLRGTGAVSVRSQPSALVAGVAGVRTVQEAPTGAPGGLARVLGPRRPVRRFVRVTVAVLVAAAIAAATLVADDPTTATAALASI